MTEAVHAVTPAPAQDAADARDGTIINRATVAPALALVLAACDSAGGSAGGGLVSTPGPAPTPTPAPVAITPAQASRFLGQATMGATRVQIAEVIDRGYEGWLAAQIAMPRETSWWDWLVARGYSDPANINNQTGFDNVAWAQLITAPDQLRQRVGMALLELLVVGIDGINLNWRQFAMAAYVDVLLDHAFGNFRTLLEKVTTNAAMASFLTFLNNRKAAANGAMPDENYARELMQLFTLGLYRLNMDGTVQTSASVPVETYLQADVAQLARVFTGLTLASTDSTTPDRYRRPLVINTGQHETGASSFLGTTVPAGTEGMAAVRQALDTIFAHPNVPPFVSKQLIQRLVTSNPSAAYVERVAKVFANNGSGVRGDLAAVVRAILLDVEARSDSLATSSSAGKLREPMMRLTGWARAFGAASPSNAWAFGNTSSGNNRLAQSPGRSASVFNFFRPGYAPPNTAIAGGGMVAPEFQITNELSVVAYVNYMQGLIQNGAGDVRADYAEISLKVGDAQALVDEVNLLLAAGQLGPGTIASIRAAVESSTSITSRVHIAILLAMASPDYLAQK